MSRVWIVSSTPSSRDSTWNGKPAPSPYLHKQLDGHPDALESLTNSWGKRRSERSVNAGSLPGISWNVRLGAVGGAACGESCQSNGAGQRFPATRTDGIMNDER